MNGRFDDDVYARARKFIEQNEQRAGEGLANEEESAPAPAKRAAPAVSASYPDEGVSRRRVAAPAGQIPGQASGVRAPVSTGEDTSGGSGLDRALAGLPVGAGLRAAKAASTAAAAYPKGALTRAAKEGLEAAKSSGVKAGMDVAQSTARGAQSRAQVQAARQAKTSGNEGSAVARRGNAEAMEKSKPVLQARPVKKPVRAKVRDEADAPEYAKGGSVKGWGKARGARACKMR